MENPTFHLEGVVHTREDMEDFEGPLTLILQLLSKNKIEIQDIRIAELLDQYLAWMDEMKAMDLEIASEFVQMASYLVYIKARMLLSAGEETDELEELIGSLQRLQGRELMERLRKITPELAQMYTRGAGTMVKPPETLPVDKSYRYSHEKSELTGAMVRILTREDAAQVYENASAFRFPARIVYSVTEKSSELVARLHKLGPVTIQRIFSECESRTELVATFIALLELCREGNITIEDSEGGTMIAPSDGK